MSRKVMITCAVTGSGESQAIHPELPITPTAITDACISAARAGAAIVHIHVRDPATGAPANERHLYREVVQHIRESGVDVLLNLTTGMGADFDPSDHDPTVAGPLTTLTTPEARMQHIIELKPDICSLDIATMNFGDMPFINTPRHLATMAEIASAHGVRPELEVFDLGQIELAKSLIRDGLIAAPPLFQLCLGIKWGAPADTASMMQMQSRLPEDAIWSGFGISAQEFPMAAQAAILGGHIRVGLEDNLYLSKGVFASNADLVHRATTIIDALGFSVMTAAEARQYLRQH